MPSKIIFKLLLTLSSTSLIATIYFIKEKYIFYCLKNYPHYFSYIIITLLPLSLTGASLLIKKHLSSECINKTPLYLEDATNSFLPSYLGYFFVALSINSDTTFWWVFGILFIFIYCSQTIYFNPILLIYNYNFYNVTTSNNKKIFLITKTKLIDVDNIVELKLKAINNFTYLEK